MRLIAVNETGDVVGDGHHKAILSDREVELVRQLREKHGMDYETLAKKFEVTKRSIAAICRLERRACTPARYKHQKEDGPHESSSI